MLQVLSQPHIGFKKYTASSFVEHIVNICDTFSWMGYSLKGDGLVETTLHQVCHRVYRKSVPRRSPQIGPWH